MLFHTLLNPVVRQFTPLSSAGFNSGKIAGVLTSEVPVYEFTKCIIFYFHDCDLFRGFIGIFSIYIQHYSRNVFVRR